MRLIIGQPISRYLWLLLLLMLLSALLARACVLRPATSFPGSHFNQGSNAAWLDIVWVMEPKSEQEIQEPADGLARRQISTAFAYASYLKTGGFFNPTYSYAAEFVSSLRAAQPGIEVQAWIGLPLQEDGMSGSGHAELEDPATRALVARFCAELLERGFDGIHLDPEPIRDGNVPVLTLLEEVRAAIGPGKTLSIATRRIVPIFPGVQLPLLDRIGWSAAYYREVARRVDQVALMTYDSALPLASLYRHFGRFQVIDLTRALEGLEVELFIGIPTCEERTPTHRPEAENMESGLLGLIDGLNDLEVIWEELETAGSSLSITSSMGSP